MIRKISKGPTHRFTRRHRRGFLADIFISYVRAISDSLSHFRDTDVRVKPTPAALPNATGVVIDFDRKICCCSLVQSRKRATANFFFFLRLELNFHGEHESRVYVCTCNITFTALGLGYVGERACSFRANRTRLTRTGKVNVNSLRVYVPEYRKSSWGYRQQFQIRISVNVCAHVVQ